MLDAHSTAPGTLDVAHAEHCATAAVLQVYEKKVSSLTGFNLEGRSNVAPGTGKVNALSGNPKVTQLRMPKVSAAAWQHRSSRGLGRLSVAAGS